MLLVIGLFTSVSIIAISVLVAAAMRTIFDLLTIGCFPFFIMMFFSGGMLPLPDLRLFTLLGHPVNANAILPTTHTEVALGRVLNHGAGLGDIGFELVAISLLTVLYYALGVWLFTRRHMRAL
jgi:ABC-2 type transport system permease protein